MTSAVLDLVYPETCHILRCGLCCQRVLTMQDSSTVGCLLQTLSSEFSFAKLSLPVPQGYPVTFRSVKLPLLSFPL